MENDNSILILVRKSNRYVQTSANPKVSVDANTYEKLKRTAMETNLSISEIVRTFVNYASEHVRLVDE